MASEKYDHGQVTDIPYTPINVRQLLADGQDAIDQEHRDNEAKSRGVFRCGSAGMIDGAGTNYGECHRIAHLRAIGVEKPVPENRKIMFAAGEGNEDLWEKVLSKSWSGRVVRGAVVEYHGPDYTVKGSPDIVLANRNGQWKAILELKLVSALNSSIQREIHDEPDSKHLIQAAAYMWLTGIPCVLCYTNRTDFAVQFSAKKLGVSKIEPFYKMFYLSFKNGVLYYASEHCLKDTHTVITTAGIEAYYERLSRMAADRSLHGRPTNAHVNGNPAAWDRCDAKYCAFAETCDRYENDYPTWVHAATAVASTKS